MHREEGTRNTPQVVCIARSNLQEGPSVIERWTYVNVAAMSATGDARELSPFSPVIFLMLCTCHLLRHGERQWSNTVAPEYQRWPCCERREGRGGLCCVTTTTSPAETLRPCDGTEVHAIRLVRSACARRSGVRGDISAACWSVKGRKQIPLPAVLGRRAGTPGTPTCLFVALFRNVWSVYHRERRRRIYWGECAWGYIMAPRDTRGQ